MLVGYVFQHETVESLLRELKRNKELLKICGFDPMRWKYPKSYTFTRFFKNLVKHQEEVSSVFEKLVDQVGEALPDFGKSLAIDGKALPSHGNPTKKQERDGRRDLDADYGVKTYKSQGKNGKQTVVKKNWFGFCVHLIGDADYELPVAFDVTKASNSEIKEAHNLIEKTKEERPEILENAEYFLADRGYDDGKLINKLWEEHDIKTVIDIRNCWKDGEESRVVTGQTNVTYDYKGTVHCHDPEAEQTFEMAYGGYEKSRDSLKYRCPASHYGIECKGKQSCTVCGSIRIKRSEDKRIFTPIARSSQKWSSFYNKRSSIERLNSRLDVSYGFEHHTIRGLGKMKMRVSIAFITMLGMALGRIKANQAENMRSLVKEAA